MLGLWYNNYCNRNKLYYVFDKLPKNVSIQKKNISLENQ